MLKRVIRKQAGELPFPSQSLQQISRRGLFGRNFKKAILRHPGVVVHLAEIIPAGVGAENHDHVFGLAALSVLKCRGQRSSARAAKQNAVLARDASGSDERLGVADSNPFIHNLCVQRAGNKVFSNPFHFPRSGRSAAQDRAFDVGADHANVRILFLQVSANTADGPAGAGGGDEGRDLAGGLLPDLGSGLLVVRLRILQIGELPCPPRAPDLARQPVGDPVVALGRVGRNVGRCDDDLGSIRPQQADLVVAHFVGQYEDAAIAAHRADESEAKSGVAGGRLNHRAARPQSAALLGRTNHAQSNAVLCASSRVERFHLDADRGRSCSAER